MPDKLTDMINGASIKILVAAFVLGGIYFEFREMRNDLNSTTERLEKKIKVISSLEKRIRNLESCK